jgi:tetratricopeptide (TPR) repeat protein
MSRNFIAVFLMLALITAAAADRAADLNSCTDGEGDQAIVACARVINDPQATLTERANALTSRGAEHEIAGRHDQAIADFNQAIKLEPTFAGAYKFRGDSYAQKKDHARAIADFNQAIKLDPKYWEAFSSRGYSYLIKGDYDRSFADYTQAVKLNPNDKTLYFDRASAYSRRGDYDRAISDLDKAIKLDPKYADAYDARGRAYIEKRDLDRALVDLTHAIELNPKDFSFWRNRSTAYFNKRDYPRTVADLDEAIKLKPDYVSLYYSRSLANMLNGNRAKALADYTHAQSVPPQNLTDESRKQQADARALLAPLLAASGDGPGPATAAAPPPPSLKRLALLIANGNYTAVRKLGNPGQDGAAVAAALRSLGFEVTEERDLAKESLKSAVRRFAAKVEKERPDWAVVYYSGHGVETRRGALMLPVDILEAKDGEKPSLHDVEEDATAVGSVIERLQDTKALTLVVFDACREDGQLAEFSRRLDMKAAGLTALRDVRGAGLRWGHNGILFSTAEGTYAWDGEPGQLSAFAKSFIGAINTEGLELNDLVKKLYDDVEKTTSKVMKTPQRPELRGQIEGKHYFRPPGAAATAAASQGKP